MGLSDRDLIGLDSDSSTKNTSTEALDIVLTERITTRNDFSTPDNNFRFISHSSNITIFRVGIGSKMGGY